MEKFAPMLLHALELAAFGFVSYIMYRFAALYIERYDQDPLVWKIAGGVSIGIHSAWGLALGVLLLCRFFEKRRNENA